MRTEKSLLNTTSNFLILVMKTILTFIVRTIFIKCLGKEYLGIDGLFTNILVMLSLADLGLAIAISYSLYRPLAKQNYDLISKLMTFYKKIYSLIGFIVLILGLVLIPFLKFFMSDVTISNILLIYLLYLFNTVSMYFLSYKETLIVADQQNYKLTTINISTYLILYILQIMTLLLLKNFILYLLVQIVITFIQRILINKYIAKNYSFINFNCKEKLESNELASIKNNVGAIIYYKIGNFVLSGTDNLVISYFLGVVYVGIYTNYLSLINMISSIINTISVSITSSFGNLIVLENENKQEYIFNKINFFCFIVYGYFSIGILFLINPFVNLWIGSNYLFKYDIIIMMVFVFYANGMLAPITSIRDAAGAYKYDKFSTIIQSIINLVFSIILAYYIGVIGVVLGTLISIILVPLWYRPFVLYKYVFKSTPKVYYIEYIKNLAFVIFSYLVLEVIFKMIVIRSTLISIVCSGIIISIVYFILILIFYRKNKSMIYYKQLLQQIIKKIIIKFRKR